MSTDQSIFLLCLGVLTLATWIWTGANIRHRVPGESTPPKAPNRRAHQLGRWLSVSRSIRRIH